jgi:hypothetical protein
VVLNKYRNYFLSAIVFAMAASAQGESDPRIQLDLPAPMQTHLLANMRQHLVVIDQIIGMLASDELDKAAELAEAELGMSSLDKHGASHIAQYYPKQSAQFGTQMHKAASRFARVAQEGDALAAYKALGEITQNCVGCHATAKVR